MNTKTIERRIADLESIRTYAQNGSSIESIVTAIDNVINDMRCEVMRYNLATDSKTNYVAAIKRYEKRVRKVMDNRPALQYAFTDERGFQYLVDGYTAVRIPADKALPLDKNPNKLDKYGMDMKPIFNPVKYNDMAYDLPTIPLLKEYIKYMKAKNGKKADVNWVNPDADNNAPVFNAEYLLAMMEIVPDCRSITYNSAITASHLVSAETGIEAIVLPVRSNKREEIVAEIKEFLNTVNMVYATTPEVESPIEKLRRRFFADPEHKCTAEELVQLIECGTLSLPKA